MLDSGDSDDLLVQATGQGDLQAFNQIVARHQTWAWRVAYRFIGNEEDASDIVQEAFLRLLDASGRYRPTAKFRTYFYQIITRLCLDRAKKKQPLLLETVPDAPDPSPDVTDTMMRQEAATAVRAALDGLPPAGGPGLQPRVSHPPTSGTLVPASPASRKDDIHGADFPRVGLAHNEKLPFHLRKVRPLQSYV